MRYSPGMNRNILGTRLILKPCPEHRVLCVSSRRKFEHKDTACLSYRPVYEFIKLITAVHLATAYLGNSVYSLPVVSVWNLLNHLYT